MDDLHRLCIFEWQAHDVRDALSNRFNDVVLVVLKPVVRAGPSLARLVAVIQHDTRAFDVGFRELNQISTLNRRDNVISDSDQWV